MRVYIVGQKWFGAAVLRECLRLGQTVVGVAAPSPTDRLALAAQAARIPVVPDMPLEAATVPVGTDLILAAHCHRYLPAAFRQAARLGALGYHPSLLPYYRGRQAIEDALAEGALVTGGSWYWLDDGWDTGRVAVQAPCRIPAGIDAATLWREHLAPLGLRLLADALRLCAREPVGVTRG